MTHYATVAPGDCIGAVEFGGIGQTRLVTLGSIGPHKKTNAGGIEQTVFRASIGGGRYWIVNTQNQRFLAAMFGDQIEGWVGKRVLLVSEASEKSDSGVAIRVAGSPDLKQDTEATIRLQGKLVKRTLRKADK